MNALRRGLLILISALGCAQSAAVAAPTQQKADALKIGAGVICDTAEKMRGYLLLYKDDVSPDAAIKTVNAKANSTGACGVASIAFVAGNFVGSVEMTGGVMRIMKITVVALQTPGGWLTIPPTEQFTALFEKMEEA